MMDEEEVLHAVNAPPYKWMQRDPRSIAMHLDRSEQGIEDALAKLVQRWFSTP